MVVVFGAIVEIVDISGQGRPVSHPMTTLSPIVVVPIPACSSPH